MPDENRDGGWLETLLGFGIIALVVWGMYASVHFVYTKYFQRPPAVIALSAYFVDDSGHAIPVEGALAVKSHLKIKGDISVGSQPVNAGNVNVTISSLGGGIFRQSVYLQIKDGHFETEDAAFRSVRPTDQIEVKAQVIAPDLNETGSLYLNHKPLVEAPLSSTTVGWILVGTSGLLIVVFLVAFTGRKTPLKNRSAIMFSYLIIIIVLLVPLVAPTFILKTFPGIYSTMVSYPTGLVITHTPDQPDNETQWALNIGGYSQVVTKTETISPSDSTHKEPNEPRENTTPAIPTKPTEETNQKTVSEGTQPPPADSGADKNKEKTSTPTTTADTEGSMPIVRVTGGVLIPLYVITLSLIGGAINMTRKVPGFQKEGEESDLSLARRFNAVGSALKSLVSGASSSAPSAPAPGTASVPPAEPAADPAPDSPTPPKSVRAPSTPTLEQQAKEIDDQLTPLVTTQLQRNSESDRTLAEIQSLVTKMQDVFANRKSNESLLKFSSFGDWAASHPRLRELLRGGWRVELLNQYMYLISAPFLAIVTYYILQLTGQPKQGAVVALSFSVGLISERIVSWILGIASGYLRTDTDKAGTKA